MKKLLAKIRKILHDRRTRQMLTRIVSVTAAIVVFITTYALVLPAITMESEANCGIEAHQHDESCYEDQLICGEIESPGHHHSEACYEVSKALVCEEQEHQHDDSCFDESGNLTCDKPEHTHDDTCYKESRELTCDIPESDGHQHSSACYERVLTCGKEIHTHSTACYDHASDSAASAPADFAAVATTELGSSGATVSASTEIETDSGESDAASSETSDAWAAEKNTEGNTEGGAASSVTTNVSATATTTAGSSSTAAAAANTATASTGNTAFDSAAAEDTYIPQLEPVIFEQLLTKDTGIYYYHAEEGEEAPESSADIADWKRVNDDTELAPADLLRVYLRYTIPAGTLNATNDIARYRLPANLHLTDQQMETINTTVNGVANQYVSLDTLEITDTEKYNTYLGIEATEGTRMPSDNVDEYFANHPDLEGQEYINAVVRAENVFDDTTGEYAGQDLIFTFSPYTVQKNQHEYDADGQPTKAGQKVDGWLCFDLHMDQIDWSEPVISTIDDSAESIQDNATPTQDESVETAEGSGSSDATEATEITDSETKVETSASSSDSDVLNTNILTEKKESSAEIIFAAKDKALKIDEISTELHLVEFNAIEEENDTTLDEQEQSADEYTDSNKSEMTNTDTADDSTSEGEADKNESADETATAAGDQPESETEINAKTYPAVSFEDTITVQAGTLTTDNETAAQDIPAETAITVSVIAEEETFPLGTTMQLGTVEDMDTVASAVEGAVGGQTRGFHAVDISFHNVDGEEIEPLKPIKVSMTSDAIKQAVEDSSTAPVVVHVENPVSSANSIDSTTLADSVDSYDLPANATDIGEQLSNAAAQSNSAAGTSENTPIATVVDTNETPVTDGSSESTDTLSFDAGAFSVYAIVYTVDFHYEVNGKTYEFSIPGGGFVSLEHLVEVLGIAGIGTNTADSGENENIESENVSENEIYKRLEEPNEETFNASGDAYEESINLNNIEVSKVTKKFVAEVASVEFSSSELVWVGKVEDATTVGGLKETNNLDVQYSSELTEKKIEEINNSTVEAGDWALISVLPFTSEESLTVTMRNGDQFVVKVTDAQISTHVITADGEDYIITVTYGPEAGIPDGAKLSAVEIESGNSEYNRYLKQSLEILGIDENNEETGERAWTITVPMARFFDISILSDGQKIEPRASVNVEIAYIGKNNVHLGTMSVVHFADTGLEVINATTSGREEGTAVSFKQGSFSVTGTIINSANLAEDEYYILKEENGRWHALASDGGTVDVTDIYDPASSSVVNYQGVKNITWEVSFTDWENDGGDGWYFIKAKGEDKYISLNGSIVSGTPTYLFVQGTTWANAQGIWIHYWSNESGGFIQRYTDHYHHMVSWANGRFGYTKYHTQRDYAFYSSYYGDQYPTELRFARVTGDSEVVNTNYPNNTYNEAQIQAWLDQAMTDKPLQDVNKRTSIYDYDNRIYQIDFSARSGVTAMAADLSMAFVTDVSNSMLFPASLTAIDGKKDIWLNSGNLDSLPHDNGQVYYTIADAKASSTVYALYYNNGWKGMDSSYYAKWKAGKTSKPSDREKIIGSSTTYLHTNDDASHDKAKYTIFTANSEWLTGINHHQIYDMSDDGQYGLQPDGTMTSYNMGNRLYYLESSVASAVNDMQIIAKEYPLGAVYAGLETFAEDRVNTLNYLKIGGYQNNMDTANATYVNNVKTIYNELKNITGHDGTDQRDAFDGVPNIGNGVALPNGTNKYVIMITDGAPNKCTTQEAINSANALKEAGYTIITVGLSTKDVSVAPEMLWKSASFVDPNVNKYSEDKTKPKYYYYAESGEDLKWILRDVVRNAMGQATVTSTVTDTIDPLFYPVDKDGNPFPQRETSYIKKDGSKCSYNDPNRVGKVEYNNGDWIVTWDNQDIPWGGWNTSLYVKAKEDFLGGNTASTNKDTSFIPESYTTNKGKSNAKIAYFNQTQKTQKTAKPATPYVNVDELKMTFNNNNFIVYLGEEVTPKEEIKKLWDSIVINTVVDQNGMSNNYTVKTGGDMYYDPNRANKLTRDDNPNKDQVTGIPLSHYIPNSDDVINNLITRLKDGNAQTTVTSEPIDYAPYGQSKIGTITVTLTKTVNAEAKEAAPDKHETQKVQNPAETYVLTVEYKPMTGSERKDLLISTNKISADDQGYMHNGDNGPGKEVNETDDSVKSTNTHKVIVYTKGLKITKTDFEFSNVLTGAKFELYRTARQGEANQKDLTGAAGKYVKVADLDTSTDGFAIKDVLPILKEGEKYYLLETKAPDGYIMLDHPIQVNLDIKKDYYTADKNERYIKEHEGTSSPEATLYSLVERSKLTLADDPAVRRTNYDGTGDLTHVGLDYDLDTITTMFYSISNNPGVELPATGGPGTNLIYLLGIMLTALAGSGLVLKRLKRNAA